MSSINKEKEEAHLPTKILKSMMNIIGRNLTCLGTTKSWLTTSRRCIKTKHPQHPQLTVLSDPGCCLWRCYGDAQVSRKSTHPPHYPNNLFKLSSHTFSSCLALHPNYATVTFTEIYDPAFVVHFYTSNCLMTHESTTIDPYDAETNRFMKFTNVVMSPNENEFYALSTQGCLVVMESNGGRLTIKGKCRTRAVPTLNANYFREYLFGSRGVTFLVFLIYQKGSSGVADKVEVFRVEGFDLVRADRLDGRVLFLDKECCLWVDSEETGCKGDCIYFTRGLGGGNEGWWMYDMESRSISTASRKGTRRSLWFYRQTVSVIEPAVLFDT